MNDTTQTRFSRNRISEFKQYLGFDKKFGYLHEVREVQTEKSKTYTARIAVPKGQGDNITYVNFEIYVKSADALIAFLTYRDVINDDKSKVTVRFSCNNTHPRAYIAQSGEREGEAIPYFGGNLSYLHSMKINGQVVHGYQPENGNQEQSSGEYVDTTTGEVLNENPNPTEFQRTHGQNIPAQSNTERGKPDLPEPLPVDAYESELAFDPAPEDSSARATTDSPAKASQSKPRIAKKKPVQRKTTAISKTTDKPSVTAKAS